MERQGKGKDRGVKRPKPPLTLAVDYPYEVEMGRIRKEGRVTRLGALPIGGKGRKHGSPNDPELARAAAVVMLSQRILALQDEIGRRLGALSQLTDAYRKAADTNSLRSIAEELERMLNA